MACNVLHVYVYTKGYNNRTFEWDYEEQEHWKPNMSFAPNPHRRFSWGPTSDQFMNGRVDICYQYFFLSSIEHEWRVKDERLRIEGRREPMWRS